ncbi:MAG: TonB-dependent receptor [Candidatus Aminicenantes bacterium]|nr:TonB-dependent receptor [Candidatus Aminicenantes bacterium]
MNVRTVGMTGVLLIVLAGEVFAQQVHRRQHQHGRKPEAVFTLKGKVENWENTAISKAVVVVPEIGKTAETDENGVFEIKGIPPGTYHFEVFAEGHMDYSSEIFSLRQDRLNVVVVMMKKISEEIVVTATRTPKLFAETPVRTKIISSEDMTRKTASNLADALHQTTGVRVENDCQNCNFTQVRINGLEGKYTQILIDSSPVVSAMTGVYGLEQIPSEMLERIEIVKGGGSVLYGGNAVAGVVNVLTKEPQSNRTAVRLHREAIRGEPFTNVGVRSGLVSRDLNTRAFLFASYQGREPVDVNGDGFSELGSISNTSFGLNFYQDFSALRAKLKMSFFRISEERRGGDLFDKPPHEANTAEWIKTDQVGLSSEWSQTLSANLHGLFSFSLVDAKRNSYYGSRQDLNAYGFTENPLWFLNGQFNYQRGKHVFSLGGQYKRDRIRDEATGYGRMIQNVYEETGIYLQDDCRFGRAFSLLLGVRLNTHTALQRAIFTPRLSFLINLTKDLSLRTSFSTGFRAPQVFDEDLHITQVGGEGMLITNAPDLREERSASLNGSLDFGKTLGGSLVQFSVEGFYNRLFDTFILHEVDRSERARIFERINGAGAEVFGASLDFGLVLGSRFSLSSGWTVQRSRLDEPEPDFGSREFFRVPDVYGHVVASYKSAKIATIDLSAEYTGSMKAPHYAGDIEADRLETTRAFWVLNGKIQKAFVFTGNSRATFFLGLENILDSYQPDLDSGQDRDSGYVYGPAKPRSLFAGFEFSF